jgi:hypothetical protein
MASVEFAHQPLDVATLRFGQAGGRQADDFRRIFLAEHAQALDDVLVGAHDARHLIHGRRLQRNRLAEMAHQKYLAEGGATLRAVQHRDRSAQAEESERGAYRLTGLERTHRQRFGTFEDLNHRFLRARPVLRRRPCGGSTARVRAPCATPATPASASTDAPVPACPRSRHSRIPVPG